MRCIACGAELRLMQSGLDNITMVPSDKHCAFLCENCDRLPVSPDGALPPTEPEPVRSELAAALHPDAVSVTTTRPTLVPSEDDLDECEILLRRAIEMVRSSTRWSHPTRSLADRMPGRSLSTRVVQIHHDPDDDTTYVATDTKSGLHVLRHRNRVRLLVMCDRIGWQVVETDAPATTTERR